MFLPGLCHKKFVLLLVKYTVGEALVMFQLKYKC